MTEHEKDEALPEIGCLVRQHSAMIFRLALRMTGNREDAEDIVQETFLQAHRKLATFRGEAKVSTWLYKIATNSTLMMLRARRSRPAEHPIEAYLPQFDEGGTHRRLDIDYSCAGRADVIVEQRELAEAALRFVTELPEIYRAAFVLRDLQGMSSKETAAILELEATTVRQRVHRARLILRGRLNKLIGAEG